MNTSCNIIASQLSKEPFSIPIGTSVMEILDKFGVNDRRYIGVMVNNEYKTFNQQIYKDAILTLFDAGCFEGEKIYRRTVTMVLAMAVEKLMPEAVLKVKFATPLGVNFYLEQVNDTVDYSEDLSNEIKRIISLDMPIDTQRYHNSDAEALFREHKQLDKIDLMNTRRHLFYKIDSCGSSIGCFYGTLASSTGYIQYFNIKKFRMGYILYHPYPNSNVDASKFRKTIPFYETIAHQKRHMDTLNVDTVSSVNRKIKDGETDEMIKIAEAQQNKLFNNLGEKLYENYLLGARVILISGPSSSGKTTFSYKLKIMLKTFGVNTHVLSMDNYFINRDQIPVDEEGKRDFERFENVDLELFNNHLQALLRREMIEIPQYEFGVGERFYNGKKMSLEDNGIVLIEGIHALNPRLVENIDENRLFKIYLAPLTTISMDNTTFFSRDDNRLVRRIVRDHKFRSYSATNTLKQWASVRRGERKNIFPYQDQADYFFNTSLFYELNVLKPYIVDLLMDVSNTEEVYADAKRILSLMDFFVTIESSYVPAESIIREFIGGSSFEY